MKYILLLLAFWFNTIFLYGQEKNSDNDGISVYYEKLRDSLKINGFPNLEFVDQTGNAFDIQSLKGKKIHINYWTFGCVPCFKEMPDLTEIANKHKDSIEFLSLIAPGKVDFNHEGFKKNLNKVNFSYRHVSTKKNLSKYGFLMVFPLHIILDENGKLLDLFAGVDLNRIKMAIANSNE